MSNLLTHGSIHPGIIKAGGATIRRTRIYCIIHGFFDLVMVSEDWFKRNHGHCNEPPKPRGGKKPYSNPERFWSMVDKSGGDSACWAWKGRFCTGGYGRTIIHIDGKAWERAHRISYRLFYNIDPAELFVCHHCDNRKCVNPKHLFLGTAKDNLTDMVEKGRSLYGEKHPRARLSESDVIEIRKLLSGGQSTRSLAKRFHVSRPTICDIKAGRSWKKYPSDDNQPPSTFRGAAFEKALAKTV